MYFQKVSQSTKLFVENCRAGGECEKIRLKTKTETGEAFLEIHIETLNSAVNEDNDADMDT